MSNENARGNDSKILVMKISTRGATNVKSIMRTFLHEKTFSRRRPLFSRLQKIYKMQLDASLGPHRREGNQCQV